MPACHCSLVKERGVTLIELAVTMTVLVILLAVAAPSFREFTRSQRLKTASSELATAMSYARSEAIKRRNNVVVAGISGDFANGWEVRDSGGVVLRTQPSLQDIAFSVVPTGTSVFTYGLDGRTSTAATDTTSALISSGSNTDKRCVSVDPTGMPRARRTTATASTC